MQNPALPVCSFGQNKTGEALGFPGLYYTVIRGLRLCGPDLLDHLVADFIHVAYDAVIAVVEDLRLGVLVHCDKKVRVDADRKFNQYQKYRE